MHVSVVKMSTVLEDCTTENRRSFAHFLWAKGLHAKDIHEEMLSVYGGKCLSRKAVHNWVENFSQGRSKVAEDDSQAQTWLRQQTKDFHAAGFDALVKRWDKRINIGGGYVDK
jgi:hypothetical protein